MRRDCYRDAATLAFVRYGELGGITADKYKEKLKRDITEKMRHMDPAIVNQHIESEFAEYSGFFKDLYAVEETFAFFNATNRAYIVDAVRAVYMAYPFNHPSHKETVYRVRAHSLNVPVSEKTVYKWLEMARALYAKKRGLALIVPPGFAGSKW